MGIDNIGLREWVARQHITNNQLLGDGTMATIFIIIICAIVFYYIFKEYQRSKDVEGENSYANRIKAWRHKNNAEALTPVVKLGEEKEITVKTDIPEGEHNNRNLVGIISTSDMYKILCGNDNPIKASKEEKEIPIGGHALKNNTLKFYESTFQPDGSLGKAPLFKSPKKNKPKKPHKHKQKDNNFIN